MTHPSKALLHRSAGEVSRSDGGGARSLARPEDHKHSDRFAYPLRPSLRYGHLPRPGGGGVTK